MAVVSVSNMSEIIIVNTNAEPLDPLLRIAPPLQNIKIHSISLTYMPCYGYETESPRNHRLLRPYASKARSAYMLSFLRRVVLFAQGLQG
jgi:hypothetical protein